MDFSTGNSGNLLQAAVLKIGPGCQQEGLYCKILGDSVTPKIYSVLDDGYVMEALRPAARHADLLLEIEDLLFQRVWCRPPLTNSLDTPWHENLRKYGVSVPQWVIEQTVNFSMVHGDPTASNALRRESSLIMCDPRPPRDYIPQTPETDMGRILQSYLGWEVAAYGADEVLFTKPTFMLIPEQRALATFWCGAAAARIQYLERLRARRPKILNWCADTRSICGV